MCYLYCRSSLQFQLTGRIPSVQGIVQAQMEEMFLAPETLKSKFMAHFNALRRNHMGKAPPPCQVWAGTCAQCTPSQTQTFWNDTHLNPPMLCKTEQEPTTHSGPMQRIRCGQLIPAVQARHTQCLSKSSLRTPSGSHSLHRISMSLY